MDNDWTRFHYPEKDNLGFMDLKRIKVWFKQLKSLKLYGQKLLFFYRGQKLLMYHTTGIKNVVKTKKFFT